MTAERDKLEVKVALLQRQMEEMKVSLSQLRAQLSAERMQMANLSRALSATTSAPVRHEVPVRVVEEINKTRAAMGLPQVKPLNLSTPWFRTAYMLQHGIFSHYDLEERHPGY